jgi:Cu/Ag efflux protein CusF
MNAAIRVAAAKGTTTTAGAGNLPSTQNSDRASAIANNAGTAGSAGTQTPGASSMTDGEVRKIDAENNKVTSKHDEMKSFDMPRMTMVFRVTDPAMLTTIKTGDRVRFAVEKQGGSLVVTRIEVVQ